MAQTRHSREIAPPLKKQRAEYTRPPRQREWFDDDDEDEDKERKRAATDFYTSYDECLLSMNPQSLAEIGGVKLHHDIRIARERGDSVPTTTVYTFK